MSKANLNLPVLRTMLLFMVASFSQPGHAGLLDSGFIAVYEVQYNQIYLGDATRKLQRNKDNSWQYSTETETKGIASLLVKDVITEYSQFNKQVGQIIPLLYEYKQYGGKKDKHFTLRFDWDKLQLANSYKKETQPIQPGSQDLLSFQLQIMLDLQSHKPITGYTIVDKKRIETYSITNKGKNEVVTPMKTFKAIELDSDVIRNKTQFKIWCAPELQYLPVRVLKIDEDGDESEFSLRSIQFLKN